MNSAELYDNYIAFKGWESDARESRPEDHEALFRLARKVGAYRVLDLGFGRGELLDWAKSRGAQTFGSEIIPELAERARKRGHLVVDGHLNELERESFDVVTAIDVLEHLTLDQIQSMLRDVRRLLKADGVFVARFPNGESPFSGPFQHGDLSHIRFLTPNSIRQLSESLGFTFGGGYNLRPLPPGFRGLKRRAVYFVRDVVETVLGVAYFGRRFPMDPNVVVVLRPA